MSNVCAVVDDGDPVEAVVAERMIAPVALIAPDSTLLYVNPAGAHALRQEREWLVGRRMLELIHPDDRRRVAHELQEVVEGRPTARSTLFRLRADATHPWRTFESTVDNLLDDPRVGGVLVSSRDVTEEIARAEALRDAAYADPLTRLPNRKAIEEALGVLVTEANEPLAVGFVSVDRLERVRRSLGHTVVDAIMLVVAGRARSCVPASMLVGQFSSDTLAVVLGGSAAGDAIDVLWRMVSRIGEAMFVRGHELRLSASAGVVSRDATMSADVLLHNASVALHHATTRGGGQVSTYDPTLGQAAITRLELEADLRRAIANDELAIALQPIVRLPQGTPVRAEALLRWRRNGTLIPPLDFISLAEESGLIVPLGDWVIDAAAHIARSAPGGQVFVNLSPRQLGAPRLVERIARVIDERRIAPTALGFEMTETLFVEDFNYAAEVMARLRDLGCPVGLDDFGTGYSSLSYLRRLPLDFIKIDGSLLVDVDIDVDARSIVGAIVTMADALHLDVIAEGVETQAQADVLADLGCSHAQGHHFGRPGVPHGTT